MEDTPSATVTPVCARARTHTPTQAHSDIHSGDNSVACNYICR